jgi:hypothetical protein
MMQLPDYRDYPVLSEYVDVVRSAGYSFPALMGWVIQSTMSAGRRDRTLACRLDLSALLSSTIGVQHYPKQDPGAAFRQLDR